MAAETLASTSDTTPERKPSRKEIGEYNRRHYTRVLPTVTACEHKYTGQPPRLNCSDCWNAFFKTSADVTGLHAELVEGGIPALKAKYGNKFVKAFARMLNADFNARLNERIDGIQEETGGSEGAGSEAGSTDDASGETEATGSTIQNDGQEEQHGELSDQTGEASGEVNPEYQDGTPITG